MREIDWKWPDGPATYKQMVERTQGKLEDVTLPIVYINLISGTLKTNDINIELTFTEFAIILAIMLVYKNELMIKSWQDIETPLKELHKKENIPEHSQWWHNFQKHEFPDIKEDIRKHVSRMRKKLIKAGVNKHIADILLPNIRQNKRKYPANKIKINKDIYL